MTTRHHGIARLLFGAALALSACSVGQAPPSSQANAAGGSDAVAAENGPIHASEPSARPAPPSVAAGYHGEPDFATRMELQSLLAQTDDIERVRQLPGFADMWIEHEPAYRIVYAFVTDIDQAAFLATLDPAIRRHVEVRKVKRTEAQNGAVLDYLAGLLREQGIEFSGSYIPPKGLFELTVGNEADRRRALSTIPAHYHHEVEVNIGPLPRWEMLLQPPPSPDVGLPVPPAPPKPPGQADSPA